MCLGTFGRLSRSLTTISIFARVRISGTLVPLCNRKFLGISYYTKSERLCSPTEHSLSFTYNFPALYSFSKLIPHQFQFLCSIAKYLRKIYGKYS